MIHRLLRVLVGSLFVCVVARAELSFVLTTPTARAGAGGVLSIELVVLNRGEEMERWEPLPVLQATASSGSRTWVAELHAVDTSPKTLKPGSFASWRYVFTLPDGVESRVVVELTGPAALRATPVVLMMDDQSGEPPAPKVGHEALSPVVQPSATKLERTFAGRLSANEPIYFIYGADVPSAKFQFSFKYRLLSVGGDAGGAPPDTLQFGFTQRSLWDLESTSSPFYDTSYMPELIFESYSLERVIGGGMTFLGYQLGFKHESNGRDGPISRSLNTAYARWGVMLGTLDGWHMLIAPETFIYVGSLSDNEELKDYRGYGQLRVFIGKNGAPALIYTGMAGRKWEHFTTQLDLSIPVRTQLFDFETFLHVQYFSGYGESLLSYNRRSEAIRAGISLVR